MDWMEDSFLQLMKSPVWSFHVGNFIDNNCLIFDDEEENKLPYTDIHNKYRIMIEEMLQEYIDDFGINYAQLQDACSSGLAIKHKDLFKYLLAIGDFLVFKSIMVKRNIELNKQAEALMLKQTSQVSLGQASHNTTDSRMSDIVSSSVKQQTMEEKDFEELLHQAMEESLRTHEQEQATRKVSIDQSTRKASIDQTTQQASIDQATRKASIDQTTQQASIDQTTRKASIDQTTKQLASIEQTQYREALQTQEIVTNDKQQSTTSVSKTNNDSVISSQGIENETKVIPSNQQNTTSETKSHHVMVDEHILKQKSYSSSEAASQWLQSAMKEAEQTTQNTEHKTDKDTTSTTDIIKEREIYLKKRRSMILEAKQQEREKQLRIYKINRMDEK